MYPPPPKKKKGGGKIFTYNLCGSAARTIYLNIFKIMDHLK